MNGGWNNVAMRGIPATTGGYGTHSHKPGGAWPDRLIVAAGAIPVSALTSDTLATLAGSDLIDIANTSVTTLLTLPMRRNFTCVTIPGKAGALWYLWEPILVSRHSFDALSEPQRRALQAAATRAGNTLAAAAAMIEQRLADDVLASGGKVVRMDAGTLAKWHKLAHRTAWTMFREQVPGGGPLIDQLQLAGK